MRIALVVNPFASRVTEAGVRIVERALAEVGEVATELTERAGHATELVEAATAAGADAVVVYAGDGGFNEALNGSDGVVPLGFVPGGGTSVLPRALGVPRDAEAAARQIIDALQTGRSRRISVGRVNGRRFGFSAGIGLDAELVRRVDELGRSGDGRRPGDIRFVATAARVLARHRFQLRPAIDVEGCGRVAFALAANCDPYSYVGPIPLHVAPLARFELGLDLVGPRELRPSDVPRFVRYVLRGSGQERDPEIVYVHDMDRIAVRCDRPLPLQVDGEDLGDVAAAMFEAERAAVSVLV